MVKWLKNRKTYLGILAASALVMVNTIFPDLMSADVFATIATAVGAWTGISFRVAVKKAQVRT